MTRFVLAADGGNSKTELVVADVDGRVLARAVGAGTSPLDDGLPATVDRLVELAERALAEAGFENSRPAAGAFYLANVDLPDEMQAMTEALAERRLVGRLEVENDTLAVLRAGSSTGWGVAVTCGAGINAVGRASDGRVERFLGLGAISGDWGGGWGLAVAGIGAAVRAGDARGPATALRAAVEAHFGESPERVAVGVHRREISSAHLHGFVPLLLDAAGRGDAVATMIVDRLVGEVDDYVRALVPRLREPTAGLEVVLGGGVLQTGHRALLAPIEERVQASAPGARVIVLDAAPVLGALLAALELAGAGSAAADHARAALRRRPTVAPA